MPLKNWFMQNSPKAVWSTPYVSVAFFPSLKHNFIAYRSSNVSSRPDCIFEIDQLWQSGFSRVYSNCCCSCSFEPEIIKIDQSSHKMYSNNIVNFQESTTILKAFSKKSGNLLNAPHTHTHTHIYVYHCFYCWLIFTQKLYLFKYLKTIDEFIIIIILLICEFFDSSVTWWSSTGVWVTTSLFKSPGLFSVFWPIL